MQNETSGEFHFPLCTNGFLFLGKASKYLANENGKKPFLVEVSDLRLKIICAQNLSTNQTFITRVLEKMGHKLREIYIVGASACVNHSIKANCFEV